MRNKRNPAKRILTLAAAVCVLAALSIAAAATGFFGLGDILLPERGRVNVTDKSGFVVPNEYEYKDFVSLSGYQDTPESKALAEWQSFLEGYDQDGAIIGEIGNSPTGFEEDYGLYMVYTQEMADRLEEIAEKYNLRLHSRMEDVLPGTWETAVGSFCKGNVTPYSGYIYEDGTFRFDGQAAFDGYGIIDYQFSRSVRGSFNDVVLNIGSAEDFQEWSYKTEGGISVTLGLGMRNRSLIMADLGDSFVLVNVLTGQEGDDTFSTGPIGRGELEALADSFDFSALTPAGVPDFAAIIEENARYMEELQSQPVEITPEEPYDEIYTRTGISGDVAREFVFLLAERIADGEKQAVAEMFVYPVQIEAPSGTYIADTQEELLAHYDETIGDNCFSLAADMTWDPALAVQDIFADGSGLASAANGAVWFGLVEDGVIRVFTLQTDQWSIRAGSGIGQG